VISQGRGTCIFLSSQTGKPKSVKCLSKQYSAFIFPELGLRVNPHLLRHYAGLQWLEHKPGEYESLSKLLAHSSSETTITFYCGAETKTAQTRWQGLLGGMIAQDKTSEAARKPRRKHQGQGDLL
jgi:integrase